MTERPIRETILDANISEFCNPLTGDCVSVAVGIQEVFGGHYVCGYETPVDRVPAHATVKIDDVLFDGTGPTSHEALYDVCISGLKREEIHEPEEHIHQAKMLRGNQLYDQGTKNAVTEVLLTAKNRHDDR